MTAKWLGKHGAATFTIIHPLWKILEKCTTGGERFSNALAFQVIFRFRFITEGVHILLRGAKWAYLLSIHTPHVLNVS